MRSSTHVLLLSGSRNQMQRFDMIRLSKIRRKPKVYIFSLTLVIVDICKYRTIVTPLPIGSVKRITMRRSRFKIRMDERLRFPLFFLLRRISLLAVSLFYLGVLPSIRRDHRKNYPRLPGLRCRRYILYSSRTLSRAHGRSVIREPRGSRERDARNDFRSFIFQCFALEMLHAAELLPALRNAARYLLLQTTIPQISTLCRWRYMWIRDTAGYHTTILKVTRDARWAAEISHTFNRTFHSSFSCFASDILVSEIFSHAIVNSLPNVNTLSFIQ